MSSSTSYRPMVCGVPSGATTDVGGATPLSRDFVRARASATVDRIYHSGPMVVVPSTVTRAPAGTERVTQQLPPTTAPLPMTVSPPRIVALA